MKLLGHRPAHELRPLTTADVDTIHEHDDGPSKVDDGAVVATPATRPADEQPTVPVASASGEHSRLEPTGRVLKTPRFSVLAPVAGWLAAWGAAALATAVLVEAGVALGFGFGIADGSVDLDTGFWAGLWTFVVQAGAFLFGGYVAGRMARTRAIGHAVACWAIAMLATAADAILVASRSGSASVLEPLRLPQWAGLDYSNAVAIPLAIFAAGALLAALVGGLLASGANRLDSRDSTLTSER